MPRREFGLVFAAEIWYNVWSQAGMGYAMTKIDKILIENFLSEQERAECSYLMELPPEALTFSQRHTLLNYCVKFTEAAQKLTREELIKLGLISSHDATS